MSTSQEPNTNSSESSPDYKAQLDDLATKARQPPQSTEGDEDNKPEGTGAVIVDKGKQLLSLPLCVTSRMTADWHAVSQIIPAVKKVLGGGDDEQQQHDSAPKTEKAPSGPPDRPVHDDHIAEFLRDQHKSIEITNVDE